jgi:Tfp pilus assembly protein PilN
MATIMIPDPGISSLASADEPMRFVAIRANLMPDEIISARQADVVRRRVLIGLVALVAVLIAGYAFSMLQTTSARSDLSDLQHRATALQNQQHEFGPLVTAQTQAQTIDTQLKRLMVGDLSWKGMLTTLRATAPAGITLSEVTGTVTAGAAAGVPAAAAPPATGGYPALNRTGREQVGTLTISGTSQDKGSVADYTDRLAKVKGLTAPFITSVTALGSKVTFSVNVLITSDALGGRYAVVTPVPVQTGDN